MGFVFGSPFGPIGAGAGAVLGFIYGNLAKRDVEAKAEVEAQRQEVIDADLERQIAERNANPAGRADPGKPAQGRKQGVIVVKDHLGDSPSGPPAGPGSGPPARTADEPVPTAPSIARATPPETDGDGFRPVYEDGRLVRRERDGRGAGQPDTVLYYAADGQLARREESSRLDGRIDMWTYYADGKVVRRESDTRGKGNVDLWIYYDESGNVARAESIVDPGRKLTQVFVDGKVAREEWRRHPGGEIHAIVTHQDGKVAQREEDSTGSGRLDLVSVFDPSGRLVKQGRRADDGGVMSWRYFDQGGGLVREEELGRDGTVVTVTFYEDGRLTRKELYELDDRLFKRAPRVPDGALATGG